MGPCHVVVLLLSITSISYVKCVSEVEFEQLQARVYVLEQHLGRASNVHNYDVSNTECPENSYSHNRSCYLVPTFRASHEDSVQYCESRGMRLLSVNSRKEGALVQWILQETITAANMTAANMTYWIGADKTSSGEWIWSDGRPMTYTNWMANQPNATLTNHTNINPYVICVNETDTSPGYCVRRWKREISDLTDGLRGKTVNRAESSSTNGVRTKPARAMTKSAYKKYYTSRSRSDGGGLHQQIGNTVKAMMTGDSGSNGLIQTLSAALSNMKPTDLANLMSTLTVMMADEESSQNLLEMLTDIHAGGEHARNATTALQAQADEMGLDIDVAEVLGSMCNTTLKALIESITDEGTEEGTDADDLGSGSDSGSGYYGSGSNDAYYGSNSGSGYETTARPPSRYRSSYVQRGRARHYVSGSRRSQYAAADPLDDQVFYGWVNGRWGWYSYHNGEAQLNFICESQLQ